MCYGNERFLQSCASRTLLFSLQDFNDRSGVQVGPLRLLLYSGRTTLLSPDTLMGNVCYLTVVVGCRGTTCQRLFVVTVATWTRSRRHIGRWLTTLPAPSAKMTRLNLSKGQFNHSKDRSFNSLCPQLSFAILTLLAQWECKTKITGRFDTKIYFTFRRELFAR